MNTVATIAASCLALFLATTPSDVDPVGCVDWCFRYQLDGSFGCDDWDYTVNWEAGAYHGTCSCAGEVCRTDRPCKAKANVVIRDSGGATIWQKVPCDVGPPLKYTYYCQKVATLNDPYSAYLGCSGCGCESGHIDLEAFSQACGRRWCIDPTRGRSLPRTPRFTS
jgi:hypothetical protein